MGEYQLSQLGLVILAGGENSRLKPLSETIYKGFLPVHGASMVARNIVAAHLQGLAGAVIVTDYHEPLVRSGIEVENFLAQELLVVGSPAEKILAAASAEPSWRPLLVCMGDTTAKVDFCVLAGAPSTSQVDSALCICRYRIPYGIVQVTEGLAVDFLEKPTTEYCVNTGYMALGPAALEILQESGDVAFTLRKLARDGQLASGQVADAFTAIDTLEDLATAHVQLRDA